MKMALIVLAIILAMFFVVINQPTLRVPECGYPSK